MTNVVTTGSIGPLLSVPGDDYDDALITSATFFRDSFVEVIYDVFSGNGYVYGNSTNTYLSTHLYGANGDAQFIGTNLVTGSSGKLSEIRFQGGGGTFVVKGSATWSNSKGINGSFSSIESHVGSEGMLLEGKLNFDDNGFLKGALTRQVVYTGNYTCEYQGRMSASDLSGTVTKIILTDNSGNSLLATGNYSVATFQAVLDATSDGDEVLNTASLFNGNDNFTVPDGSRHWHAFAGKDTMTGGVDTDFLYGDDGNDVLYGMGSGDELNGGSGDDILDGGAGDDTAWGGTGNDIFIADSTNDVFIELDGEGVDTVKSSASFTLGDFVENLILTGTSAIEGTGNGLANSLTGNAGDNVLDGMGGADKMDGGAGNDTYIVDNAGDSITDKSGIDSVRSSVTYTLGKNIENLYLTSADDINGTGNSANNFLNGNDGHNTLSGDRGNDTLDGGLSEDVLSGGKGADIFVFSALDGSSDTVTDFKLSEKDKIDIGDLLSGAGYVDGASVIGDFVMITTNGPDSILSVDVDGAGAGGFVQIATLKNVTGLEDEAALAAAGTLILV